MSKMRQETDDRQQAQAFAWPLQPRQPLSQVSQPAMVCPPRRRPDYDLHQLY